MNKFSNTKLLFFFTGLTVVLTWSVIFAYGHFLRQPFYTWVEATWPGRVTLQDQIEQSVEHFFISTMVDVVVVSLLLRLVNHQQRELKDSETRYRALFEHASDAIAVVTASDHLLVETNKKFSTVLGYEPQPLIGSHACHLFESDRRGPGGHIFGEPAARQNLPCKELDALTRGQERQTTIRTFSGASLAVAVSCSAISVGKERLFILIIRDLTEHLMIERERQEMQRQLFQTSKLASIGELSAGVAHEINNPLHAMINFAELLKDDGVARTRDQQQMLDGIIEEGQRIARIVRNLLTFARQDPHTPAQVVIADVVQSSVSLFGHQLQKDGVQVEVDTARATLPVHADASRLRQVMVNVISNAHHALKAKAADGKLLRITAADVEREASRLVRVEFYDNGVGIRPDHLDKVFDPFFTTRRDSGGTGLGLSLSFGIIHDCGGDVRVESEQGRFTRFILELPVDSQGRGDEGGENFTGR